ncbi:MAG: chromosome segregation protein SMC [Ruminococcaceae bacterium]|nr:chromosome segregation protein SMC [Oscillospiraceae bacterium]
MRLKTLELQGFKSFADKTVLSFDRGVTAVVGPNGSGKSNISDAMRWVLGELSSKSIRGKKMEDVIFGGTDNRRPMGYAEVSLTIDNTDPENRMAIDYDEVTVTRRYYRTGDSEYMINRKPVRLKDINELFMNTGIGRGGYSMIGQGKAAEIISQKSDERRNIFEEAAGIAKYRARKNEAERKLSETDDNLIRIGDILSELQGRVGPLERDAAKARRYLDLYEEKKALDVGICVYDISDIKNKTGKLKADFEIAKHELEIAEDTLKSLETQRDRLYDITQANKLRYEELNRLINESNRRRFDFEASGKVLENDIKHLNETIESSSAEKERISKSIEAANALLDSSVKDTDAKKEELLKLVEKYTKGNSLVSEYDERIDSLGDEIDSKEMSFNEKKDEAVKAKIDLSALEASGRSRDERRTMLEDEISEIDESLSLVTKRIEQADKTIASYQQNIDEASAIQSEKDAFINECNEEILKLTDKKNRLTLDISAKKQRIDTLRRMEELFEGYTGSVRSVMSASDDKKLKGIIGPLSRIIEVDSKYSLAIETSLGQAIQNIVCETEKDAKDAIRYLKDNRKGRATFYPLTSVKPQYLAGNIKPEAKGYIGIASDLVRVDERYRNIVDSLLARTCVYETIDDANVAAKNNSYKLRCVTLDGQQINAGGSFTGGSARNDSGILTRSNEIDNITAELKKAESELKDTESRISEEEKKIADISVSRDDIAAKNALFASLAGAEETQKKILISQKDSDQSRKDALLTALADIDKEQLNAENSIASEKNRIAAIEKDIEALEAQIRALLDQRRSLTEEQSEISVKTNAVGIDIERKKKDIEAGEYEISIRRDALDELISKRNIEDNKISAANEKLESIAEKISGGKEQSEKIAQEIEAMQKEIEEINRANIDNEAKDSKLRLESKDISHKHEIFLREYTKLEAQCEAVQNEQDKLIAHLWDEYELSYGAALELEYPEITENNRNEANKSRNELKNKIRALGSVNVNAIEEYEEVKTRFDFLSTQYTDLTKSKEELGGVIYKLEAEMRTKFISVFDAINTNFKDVFRELFGGGTAELSLSDPENVLESGIEINVAPPGKIIKNLSLLSGGEQSFVAIALFFAILKVNPTPFCVLDEIEAALDEVNVARFAQYCQKYSSKTQFIVITHRRGTMETSDVLYGVTMYERGISKVLSVNVDEVEKKIGVKL